MVASSIDNLIQRGYAEFDIYDAVVVSKMTRKRSSKDRMAPAKHDTRAQNACRSGTHTRVSLPELSLAMNALESENNRLEASSRASKGVHAERSSGPRMLNRRSTESWASPVSNNDFATGEEHPGCHSGAACRPRRSMESIPNHRCAVQFGDDDIRNEKGGHNGDGALPRLITRRATTNSDNLEALLRGTPPTLPSFSAGSSHLPPITGKPPNKNRDSINAHVSGASSQRLRV